MVAERWSPFHSLAGPSGGNGNHLMAAQKHCQEKPCSNPKKGENKHRGFSLFSLQQYF